MPPVDDVPSVDDEEITTISIDDGGDEDVEALIAQALELGDDSEAGGLPAEVEAPPMDSDASAGTETTPEGETTPEVEEITEPETAPEAPTKPETVADTEADAAVTHRATQPTLTPAAAAALRALRTEGMGQRAAEVILDLGDEGTPEERDRVLQAALAHVEMQDAVYRVPTTTGRNRRIGAALTTLVLAAALWVAIAPPRLLVPPAPPTITAVDRRDGVHAALWLQAQQVEAFRVENGRLPRSLEEVRGGFPDLRYVRSTTRQYQLVAHDPDGRAIMYDSASPNPVFETVAARFTTRGVGS